MWVTPPVPVIYIWSVPVRSALKVLTTFRPLKLSQKYKRLSNVILLWNSITTLLIYISLYLI